MNSRRGEVAERFIGAVDRQMAVSPEKRAARGSAKWVW